MSAEQVKQAMKGKGLQTVDTIAAAAGLPGHEVMSDLAVLEIMGEVEERGGRYKLKSTPRSKTYKGRVGIVAKPKKKAVTVEKKRGLTIKRNAGTSESDIYPFTACTTRYRSGKTGRLVKTPQSAKPSPAKPGRATVRRGRVGGLFVTRTKVDGEVMSAKVIHGDMRKAQRRGQVKKSEVRELERDLSRDALETYNPRMAAALDSERMHEAHRSDKAKRAAATRKKNVAAGHGKKKPSTTELQTKLLRAEHLVKDAERRHKGAKTPPTRAKYGETLRKRRAVAAKLRADLQRAGG